MLRAAGKNDENKFLDIISKPGLWMQKLTTKEPDRRMVEVAIKAVEAVFDWREFVTEYHEGEEDFVIEESSPEDFVTDEEKAEAAIKQQEAYKEALEQQANADREAVYEQQAAQDIPADEISDAGEDDMFTFEDENGHEIEQEPEYEEENLPEGELDPDDGIVFDEDIVDDEEEHLYADDVPLFKQRKTDK